MGFWEYGIQQWEYSRKLILIKNKITQKSCEKSGSDGRILLTFKMVIGR
jgi:hypothetical protein